MPNYIIERVPMPPCPKVGRQPNPITLICRKLAVGESFLVRYNDPNWRVALIRNLNVTEKDKHFFTVQEAAGYRIYRDK